MCVFMIRFTTGALFSVLRTVIINTEKLVVTLVFVIKWKRYYFEHLRCHLSDTVVICKNLQDMTSSERSRERPWKTCFVHTIVSIGSKLCEIPGHVYTACASDINSYLTPLGQAREFIETCRHIISSVESNLFTFGLLGCFCPGSQKNKTFWLCPI